MKEVSLLEMIGRSLAKVAAGAGVAAVIDLVDLRAAGLWAYAIWLYPASIQLLN